MSVFELLRAQVDLVELADGYTDMRSSGKTNVGRYLHPDHERTRTRASTSTPTDTRATVAGATGMPWNCGPS